MQNNENEKSSSLPRIDKIDTIAKTKWLQLESISYTDQGGKSRKWDSVSRTTTPKDDNDSNDNKNADAVVIIPILKYYNNENSVMDTILVEQFRPPMGQKTMEFPAGLIDEGETPSQAALRELREETGYVGEACKTLPTVSRRICMSPGITNESVHIVVVTVDLDNPYNVGTPQPTPEEGEYITVHRVSLKDGLRSVLDNEQQSPAMPIEGLYLFSLGLEMGKSMMSGGGGGDRK